MTKARGARGSRDRRARAAFVALGLAVASVVAACDFLGFDDLPSCDRCTTDACRSACDAGAPDAAGPPCDGSSSCNPTRCGEQGLDCLGGACLDGICQALQLATGPFCFTGGLVVHTGDVYYSVADNATGDAGAPPGHVRYVPVDGTACKDGAPCTLLDAPDHFLFDDLAATADALYGVELGVQMQNAGIFQKPFGAGPVVVDALGEAPNAKGPIGADATRAYFYVGSSKKVFSIDLGGSFEATTPVEVGSLGAFVSGGSFALGADEILLGAHDKDGPNREVLTLEKTCPGGGCKAKAVLSTPISQRSIAVGAQGKAAYLAFKPTSANQSQVWTCGSPCANPTELQGAAGTDEPGDVLVDDTRVFLIGGSGSVTITSLPRAGGAKPVVHTKVVGDPFRAVAQDASAIYFVTAPATSVPCGASLWRVAKF